METEKSYALIVNVDETILRLNPYCEKFGFEIKFIDLQELEKVYGSLFGLKNIERPLLMGVNTKSKRLISVSHEFWSRLKKHHVFSNYEYHEDGGFYFLIKNKTSKGVKLNDFEHFQYFNRHLINTLRLFKTGDIGSPFDFFKSDNLYHIGQSGHKAIGLFKWGIKYKIDESEIQELTNLLNLKLTSNEISNIAIKFFMNCYETHDYEIKLINSMIAFESLFNRGKDQLRHIIARHAAVLISETQKEFETIYIDMKKLYDLRSSLVHNGQVSAKSLKPFGTLRDAVIKLMNYLRKVLVKCYKFQGDKDELFNELNLAGVK